MDHEHDSIALQEVRSAPGASRPAASADDLRRWLASGRCQSPGGAFYAWIDGTTGAPSFEYPEITGYALTHFAGLKDLRDDELAAGHAAARWLIERFSRQDFSARANWDDNTVYNFDLGMIATGLLTFGSRIDEAWYIAAGKSLVCSMQTQLEGDRPFSSLRPDRLSQSSHSGWATEGHAHLLKIVQSFLVADQLGQPGAGGAATKLISQIVAMQQEDGRFITQPGDALTMLHPHLYAVEGLWMLGTARGDAAAIRRAQAAIRWVWEHQMDTGGFPRFVAIQPDQSIPPEQIDVTSQAVRMALALDPEIPGLPRAIARLTQIARNDTGGMALPYQPTATELHLNVWVTLFGHQALTMAEKGPSVLDWQYLV